MATVGNELTPITDMEGTEAYTTIGSGPMLGDTNDVFIQGGQSGVRREDNRPADHGFYVAVPTQDISGADLEFAQVWANDGSASWTDETVDANDVGDGDWTIFDTAVSADISYLGFALKFGLVTFDNANGTAGVGGTVIWEYWDGDSWEALAGVSDGTTGFTAAVADGQTLTFTVPTDWVRNVVNSSDELFFIRARATGGYSTPPVYDQGFIGDAGAGTHLGMWVNHFNYSQMTKLALRFASATPASNFEGHNFPVGDYPLVGGWVRVWVDVSRTPDDSSGTLDKTALVFMGLVNQIPNIGGNQGNMFMDSSDFTLTGLSLTGTVGLWQDFLDDDEGTVANKFGVVVSVSGIIYCLARLTLGAVASLVFDDSGFVIVFPDQSLVAADFMGITIDLQHASTNIDWADAVIRSAGAVQGDIVVTGTSGAFDAIGMTLANLRTISLTAACSLTNSVLLDCDKLIQNGATLTGLTVSGSTTADAEAFIISDDPGLIDDCTFEFSDGHAIEITATGTYDMDSNVFNNFGADGTNDAAIFNNSGGLVTLNITNGLDPSIRNGGGASTDINNNVTATVTVKDATGAAVVGARVSVRLDSDNTEILGGVTDGSGEVSGTVGAGAGGVSVIVRKGSGGGTDYVPVRSPQTVGAGDFNVTISMSEDPLNTT